MLSARCADAEAAQNARYIVSLSRKIGGGSLTGLIVWEDIVYVKHKAIVPFVGWLAGRYTKQ